MRLALLGGDAESLALAEAAVVAGHEIAWHGDLGVSDRKGRTWLVGSDRGDEWEDLFDPATADAVIVGRGAAAEDLRARQVQELVKLGRPVLAVHPLFTSVLTYFEIDMARGESGCLVEHFNPLVESPAAGSLAEWVGAGHRDFGDVEQILATRPLADRSPESVLWHFARDVELLNQFAGSLDKLGAHAGGKAEDYSGLAVQLSGPRQIPVRWAVEPPAGSMQLRIVLVCQGGRLAAVVDDEGRSATLDFQVEGAPSGAPKVLTGDAAAGAVDRFVSKLQRGDHSCSWPRALRAMELADTIEIALRRGRMIEVHRQELTEQLAFKGTMAALGCGVLAAVIPLALAAAFIAGQFGAPVGRFVPHLLLGFLALFLALQLLPRLLGENTPRGESPKSDDGNSS